MGLRGNAKKIDRFGHAFCVVPGGTLVLYVIHSVMPCGRPSQWPKAVQGRGKNQKPAIPASEFFPNNSKNLRYPHIGVVLIEDNCEIGCGSTIDRGSMSNTVIGKNTYLDNQIHIAHNVKIGENSIIAGQVGIAGSSMIGNNVKIGGQAGISGHLKIGNNVEIGGGSGVIRDIPDNTKVMGYPAKNIRKFLRDNK